jgi:hypothetical protein
MRLFGLLDRKAQFSATSRRKPEIMHFYSNLMMDSSGSSATSVIVHLNVRGTIFYEGISSCIYCCVSPKSLTDLTCFKSGYRGESITFISRLMHSNIQNLDVKNLRCIKV